MTCATHPEVTAAAYCRTCGKALCADCMRNIRGAIYCEDCIATRLQSAAAATGAGTTVVVTSGPSPALAGVLAGFFPFGVGAVYTGRYIKGLVHLVIFIMLVAILSSNLQPAELFGAVFGIALAFFYVYQIVDAVRTAQALQTGQPVPDPFGLERLAGGQRVNLPNVPLGAIILIGLGLLFLLGNMGLLHLHRAGRFWPLILIVLGLWLFARRWRIRI
ncbi:MAG: B-box zinc finger protein [Terriglobales bacterium]